MKRKELKNIAKQIAKYERIIQTTDDKNLRHDAENAIIQLSNKVESLTYEYYYNNIKPKNKQTSGSKVGWRCVVCGYIYEGEDIPEDYICPLCKHGIKDFEKVNY